MIYKYISESDLTKINTYSRKEQTIDSVYVFDVVLCNNEIDKDFERFSIDTLQALAPMFLGKTGFIYSDSKGHNFVSRIFDTKVTFSPLKATKSNEPFARLVGRAYVARTSENADFITEIESGIKKEVSFDCAVSSAKCSICGNDRRQNPCKHKGGKVYEGNVCHTILKEPTDVYEWSFVKQIKKKEDDLLETEVTKKDTYEIIDAKQACKDYWDGKIDVSDLITIDLQSGNCVDIQDLRIHDLRYLNYLAIKKITA